MVPHGQSPDRGSVGAERVAAWILVVLAVALAFAVVTGPGATVATNAPDAAFDGSYDAEANALTVEHAGGDPVRAGPTDSLVVAVADDGTDGATNVTWVADDGPAVGTFPVTTGDAVRIDDATVDADGDGDRFDGDATVGFELDEGDVARVIWRGRPLGAPEPVTRTLATVRVGAAA